MSDDLVKRLRRDAQAARDYLGPPEIAPSISLDDAEDAADRIEALEAEVARLKAEREEYDTPAWEANEHLNGIVERMSEERDAIQAQISDLRLELIAAYGQHEDTYDKGFRAGAEAMQEAAAKLHDEAAAKLAGGRKRINQFDQYIINVLERKAEELRALPIGAPT